MYAWKPGECGPLAVWQSTWLTLKILWQQKGRVDIEGHQQSTQHAQVVPMQRSVGQNEVNDDTEHPREGQQER